MRRLGVLIALLLVLVMMSGCSIWSNRQVDPEYENFYQGTQGVEMRFLQGSPPPRLFYYANDATYENTFSISVELRNVGASDAIGALYISGYSPHIIRVVGTDLSAMAMNDCSFGFGSGGFGSAFNFAVNCLGVDAAVYGTDRINVRVDSAAEYLGLPVTFDFSQYNDEWAFNVGWDMFADQWDMLNHGRMMIIILSALDFEQYNGYPFNSGVSNVGSGILKGDNYYTPGGEYGFENFEAMIYDWPAGLDEVMTTFQIDSCYGYATYVAPLVCIDPHPYDERDKVCYPQEYSWSGSQGAPVAITSLKQDQTPRSIFLTFTIRNVGTGEIIHPGHLERCRPYFPGKFDSRFKDVVYVGDIRIGNQRLTCTPGYEVRLNNGVGTFTCEYRLEYAGSANAYETPVVAEIWYGYHDYIKTQTLIKRAS
jgi:hypothetical protein